MVGHNEWKICELESKQIHLVYNEMTHQLTGLVQQTGFNRLYSSDYHISMLSYLSDNLHTRFVRLHVACEWSNTFALFVIKIIS